ATGEPPHERIVENIFCSGRVSDLVWVRLGPAGDVERQNFRFNSTSRSRSAQGLVVAMSGRRRLAGVYQSLQHCTCLLQIRRWLCWRAVWQAKGLVAVPQGTRRHELRSLAPSAGAQASSCLARLVSVS